MQPRAIKSEVTLGVLFVALISLVPLVQAIRERIHGERAQAADVLRMRWTASNLRQYERALEAKSWVQPMFREPVVRLAYDLLGDGGAQVVRGVNGWLFYRPDVRYLVEPDRMEPASREGWWRVPGDGGRRSGSVVRAIVRFRDQLRERGIELMVVPVPGKPSVYPDQLTRRVRRGGAMPRSPTEDLLERLGKEEVATVDLFAVFRSARADGPSGPTTSLYLARDTHWTPAGARLAAAAVAEAARRRGWAPPGVHEFTTTTITVNRWGDVLGMGQVPGRATAAEPELVECEQVLDPRLGRMVPSPMDRPGTYQYPSQPSRVLVLGDSFSRIYQMPEPKSLGAMSPETGAGQEGGTQRLLPGSAGFVAHLARSLQAPVDCIVSDGGASSDVRRRLATQAEVLEGKTLVVWEFVEREVQLGRAGWEDVPLPARLGPVEE